MFYSSLNRTVALSVSVLAMVFLISYFVLAWQEPTLAPPGGNVPAPLNVSLSAQAKEGALVLAANPIVTTGLIVQYGNVGIGTTTPTYKLDVVGDVRWTGTLQGGSVPWARLTSYPAACFAGQYVSAIGSTLTCSTPSGSGGIGGSGTATQVAFFTASTTIGSNSNLYWDNTNQRLGIGLTGPSHKLDVSGDINVSGVYRRGGTAGTSTTCGAGNTPSGITISGGIITSAGSCAAIGGGGGGITQLNQGTGIILSPNPIMATGIISADTSYLQRIVSDYCSSGSSIRRIYSDGTVACETDDVGGGGGISNAFARIANSAGTVQISASGEDTLRLAAGTGLSITYSSSPKQVTYSANTSVLQARVSGSCSVGQAIRVIDSAGNVTCQSTGGVRGSPTPRVCTSSGSGSAVSCTTAACPAGSYRSGCSVEWSISNCTPGMNSIVAKPSGSDACYCYVSRGSCLLAPTMNLSCFTYCVE